MKDTLEDRWGEPQSSLEPAVAELVRFFREYRVWFNQKLPLPVLTIQSGGRSKVLGWFAHQRLEQTQLGNRLDEINICPEHLSRGVLEIGHTMIHEMVHYANARVGIQDCNANQYHNGRFKQRAEEVGLECEPERHPRIGWGFTRLSPVARQRVEAIALEEGAFSLFRKSAVAGGSAGVRRQQRVTLRKWVCECVNVPGVWRATGQPLNAMCLDCQGLYRPLC